VLLDTRFLDSSQPWTDAGGDVSVGQFGLRVGSDARVDFVFDEASHLRSGTVTVSFVPPTLDAASLGPLEIGQECYCAFKVRTGRVEVELSERWVRVQRYDSRVTQIEKVLHTSERSMQGDGEEHTLTLSLDCGRLRVAFDGKQQLVVENVRADLGDLHIATYRHAFTITHFRVEAHRAEKLTVDRDAGIVEVAARFHPERFNNGAGLQQHHFVVWEGGKAAEHALFTTSVSDSTIHEALQRAGGTPGNNLTQETWTARRSARSDEPDKHVRGTPLAMEVVVCDTTFAAADVLTDLNGKPLDFRFGGNLALIPQWRSGCVTCLQSCPGGKVGNHTYTIRDLVENKPRFEVADKLPLRPGDEVTIRFKLKK